MDDSELRAHHPDFAGDWTALAAVEAVAQAYRGTAERIEALQALAERNTTRNDAVLRPNGMWVKGPFRIEHASLDLRGADFTQRILGPVDLTGADLRGARLRGTVATRARLGDTDLRGADLTGAWLLGADLAEAHVEGAQLDAAMLGDACLRGVRADWSTSMVGCDLQGAILTRADLRGVPLVGSNLQLAQLLGADLRGADLSGCDVFGVAAWEVQVDEDTKQQGLRVTPHAPRLGVHRSSRRAALASPSHGKPLYSDSLGASGIVLQLSQPDLYEVLTTLTSHGVLLLGRFAGQHGEVLDALRTDLRALGFVGFKFDFERPPSRTIKETVVLLASMSRFVVADLSEASSVPYELSAVVSSAALPIVPIQRRGLRTYSMFQSLRAEHPGRVLDPLEYRDLEHLRHVLSEHVVKPALERARALEAEKARPMEVRRPD